MERRSFVLILLYMVIDTKALLPFVKPCPRIYGPSFDHCILDSIRTSYPNFMDANPEYNLPAMDPLQVEKLVIEDGSELLGYTINCTNVTVKGLRDVNIIYGKVDPEIGKVDYDVFVPFLNLTNNYFLSGRLLALYANGSGDSSMNLTNINATIRARHTTYRALGRDGIEHDYYNITKIKLKMDIGKVKMQFNNLFKGNKYLENEANKFLTRNWRQLFKFMGPAVERAIVNSLNEVMERIKEHLTLDELYPYVINQTLR